MYHIVSHVKPKGYAHLATPRSMEPWERLKKAREGAGYDSASSAARAYGWPEARYRHHENGQRNFRRPDAITYAKVLKTTPEWLMFGKDGPATIRIYGHVGPGQLVTPVGEGEQTEIDPPPGVSIAAAALMVRGESLWPRYFDGDMLIFDDHMPPSRAAGEECVVKMTDGSKLVKVVRFRDNIVSLESHNAAPIEDADIEWVAPIKWVRRRAR